MGDTGGTLVWWAVVTTLVVLIGAFLIKVVRHDDTAGLVKCPACSEFIKLDAKVCRYCGRER
jgi:hypothetical protein